MTTNELSAMERMIIGTGKAQKPPAWTKVPDCACFRVMSEQRNALIDECIMPLRELMSVTLDASNTCDDAVFAFVGALFLNAAGVSFARSRAPGREEALMLDLGEEQEFLELLKDSYQNAVDRFLELQQYFKKKDAH